MYSASPLPKDAKKFPPNSSPARIADEIYDAIEPSEEELTYHCNDEELKLLSQHYRIKVDMTKFNCLHHFYRGFEKRGSLKNRSKESTLRLLIKAYKHYKNDQRHIYSQEEIDFHRAYEWKYRKSRHVTFLKNHNTSLDEENRQALEESDTTENTVIESGPLQSTESMSMSEAPAVMQNFMLGLEACNMQLIAESQTIEDDSEPIPDTANSSGASEAFVDIEYLEEGSQPIPETCHTQEVPQAITEDDSEALSEADNSMRCLESEIYCNLDSADPCEQVGTESIANSLNSSGKLFPSQNTDYSSFNKGIPRTSTQDN